MYRSVDRVRLLELENALHRIARSTAALWVAIERGVYTARSVCGDRTLDIKEALEECGFSLPLGERRKSVMHPIGELLSFGDWVDGKMHTKSSRGRFHWCVYCDELIRAGEAYLVIRKYHDRWRSHYDCAPGHGVSQDHYTRNRTERRQAR